MEDYYVNENCVNGNCPLIVEEELYGVRGKCENYCKGFNGCNTCYFEGSTYCKECIRKTKGNKK